MSPPSRQRLPRDRLTKKLLAIAAGIAERPVRSVVCRVDFLGEAYRAGFRVVRLWAFGSWARGAPMCGDLDLIVEVAKHSRGPYPATHWSIAVEVRGRRRRVDVHVGTPAKLGEIARDAVLIWSEDQPDFAAAIGAVQQVDTAQRHHRPLDDVLPLDPGRLMMPFEDREDLPGAVTDRLIAVTWTGRERLPALPADMEGWAARLRLGARSRRVLPLAVELLRRWIPLAEIPAAVSRPRRELTLVGRGVVVDLERWRRSYRALDHLGTRAIGVIPHWTRRGPNGVLVLERGARHPIVEHFAAISAWMLGDGVVHAGAFGGGLQPARVLELYSRRSNGHEAHPGSEPELKPIEGLDLLAAIDDVDAVMVDDHVGFPVSILGRLYLEDAELLGSTAYTGAVSNLERLLEQVTTGQALHRG